MEQPGWILNENEDTKYLRENNSSNGDTMESPYEGFPDIYRTLPAVRMISAIDQKPKYFKFQDIVIEVTHADETFSIVKGGPRDDLAPILAELANRNGLRLIKN